MPHVIILKQTDDKDHIGGSITQEYSRGEIDIQYSNKCF